MRRACLFLLLVLLAGCATPLTPLQRRNIEARDLEGSLNDAFKATMQVLQDRGYIIKAANLESGLIQGETGTKGGWMLGFMTNYEVTATLEQFGDNVVKERLTIVKKTKTVSKDGTYEDSYIVDDPELFQGIYDEVQKEMFVRKNLNK